MSLKTARYVPGKGVSSIPMPVRKPPALVRSVPKKSRPKYKLSGPMKNQVKQIINQHEETNQKQKLAFGTGSGSNYVNHDFPGIPANQTDIMRLIPTVPQGDERDERDGAKIRITSLTGSFFCHVPAAYVPATGSEASAAAGLSCRLLILSCKQVQAVGQFEQNWAAGQNFNRQFLKNGSQPTGFNGDLWSLRWPVNTQLFTKHYERYFTLNRGVVTGTNNVTPEVFKNIKFRIKCKISFIMFSE